MHRDFKRLTDFLVGIGVERVPHTQARGAAGWRGAALLFVICIAPCLHASDVRSAPPKRDWQPVDLFGTASEYWFSRNWRAYYWREDFTFVLAQEKTGK